MDGADKRQENTLKPRKMNKRISQWMDQELGAAQQGAVIDEIIRHGSAGRTWQRYQLIGDIARGDINRVGTDLTEKISERLQAEPTVIAPRQSGRENRFVGSDARTGIWKPAGLFALAASLVVAAVVTLGPLDDSFRYGTIAAVDQTGARQSAVFAEEFNEMLAGHGEFTSSPAFNGLLARVVLVSNQTLAP